MINEVLAGFKFKCSLSIKGSPYNNAVAEATYKDIKTELINNRTFETPE